MTQDITLKELFERLVAIETRFSEKSKQDIRVTKRFAYWAGVITVLQLLNLWVHSLSILK